MRYSPVSPPQDLFLPYQQKDRQQSFLSRLLPIVFDDKALSGVFILFILPAYLQLAPLPNRECCGLPMVNRYHGTLTPPRIAPSRPFREKTEVSLYPASASSQAAAPHGCYSSPEVAHSLAGGPGVGSCVASQKRKDPQH
ncbi:hypothetical protein HMPREF1135_01103 [Lachnoanaerobaculum sp. OBRC5-5]|jgi:hypothetical protein|nr:hypothetical protein HMPREF1135_01103 [Lachnoanaerobaculum sp. OBRC5-5]